MCVVLSIQTYNNFMKSKILLLSFIIFMTSCNSTSILESSISACKIESSQKVDGYSIQNEGDVLLLRLNSPASNNLEPFNCIMKELSLIHI